MSTDLPAEFARAQHAPLWQATMPAMPAVPAHPLPDTADVVVVGGGITGLSAARELARAGASVVLLESRTLGWGASSRSGGMVLSGFKYGLDELCRRYGRDTGRALLAESVLAVDHVARLEETEGIRADMRREGHLELAYSRHDADELEAYGKELGDYDGSARWIPRAELRTEIGTDAYYGGLLYPQDGGIHPGKLTQGLAERAVEAGVDVHEHTRATAIRPQRDGRVVVETSRGALIARQVFLGTNGYGDGAAPDLRRRIMPISSFIIATEPLDPELLAELTPRGRMFFDTKNFLYYWRGTADGRMMFGGRASFWPTSDEKAAGILHAGMLADPPAARRGPDRLLLEREGRVHLRPDAARGPIGQRLLRDRLLRERRRALPVPRDRDGALDGRRSRAGARADRVPARPRAVRGPHLVPAVRRRVVPVQGPPERAGGARPTSRRGSGRRTAERLRRRTAPAPGVRVRASKVRARRVARERSGAARCPRGERPAVSGAGAIRATRLQGAALSTAVLDRVGSVSPVALYATVLPAPGRHALARRASGGRAGVAGVAGTSRGLAPPGPVAQPPRGHGRSSTGARTA